MSDLMKRTVFSLVFTKKSRMIHFLFLFIPTKEDIKECESHISLVIVCWYGTDTKSESRKKELKREN